MPAKVPVAGNQSCIWVGLGTYPGPTPFLLGYANEDSSSIEG